MESRERVVGERGSRWRWPFAVAALFLASLGLRAVGLDHQLPHYPEPDLYLVMRAQSAALERGEPEPEFLDRRVLASNPEYPIWVRYYPPLFSTLLGLLPVAMLDVPPDAQLAPEEHARRATGSILRARMLVAGLASLMVPLTYLLARRFMGRGASLLAAALIATSALHLWFSGTARPHAAAASMILLALLAALHLRRKPTLLGYAAAGAAGGLAVASLQTGLFVVPALFAAYLLRPRPWRWDLGGLLLGGALLGLGGYWAYPDVLDRLLQPGAGEGGMRVQGGTLYVAGQPLPLHTLGWQGPARLARVAWEHDPLLSALAALGALLLAFELARLWLRRGRGENPSSQRAELLVVAAHALPYLCMLLLYARTVERYLLPLAPAAACLAAYAAVSCAGWIGRARAARSSGLLALGAALLLAFPTYVAVRIAWLRQTPDTLEQAARWIEAHADPRSDAPAFGPGRLPPLPFDVATVRREMHLRNVEALRWPTYLANGARYADGSRTWPLDLTGWRRNELALEALAGRLVVAEHSRSAYVHPVSRAILAALRADSEPVVGFGPRGAATGAQLERDVREHHVGHSDVDRFVWRVLSARNLGPGVEIRRLRPEKH